MSVKPSLDQLRVWWRKIIYRKEIKPKVPRKKLDIQFNRATEQFNKQVSLLDQFFSDTVPSSSVRKLGQQLMADVQRFQELHLVRINQGRLKNMSQPFVHHVDFSMWVLYQLYAYTEEIHHFLQTARMVEI